MSVDELELLADLEHARWSHWMKYMFSVGQINHDGTWTMPKQLVDRWTRQMNTDYADLSDTEKESDRKEAKKSLEIINEIRGEKQ